MVLNWYYMGTLFYTCQHSKCNSTSDCTLKPTLSLVLVPKSVFWLRLFIMVLLKWVDARRRSNESTHLFFRIPIIWVFFVGGNRRLNRGYVKGSSSPNLCFLQTIVWAALLQKWGRCEVVCQHYRCLLTSAWWLWFLGALGPGSPEPYISLMASVMAQFFWCSRISRTSHLPLCLRILGPVNPVAQPFLNPNQWEINSFSF